MVRKTARQRIDPDESPKYAAAAAQFFDAADLARDCRYWNAAGLLLVHGSIAWADAVAIRLKGVKSTSDDHKDAVALLGEVLTGVRGRDEALTHLHRIIDEKNRVSYEGITFQESDMERLARHTERFRRFVEGILKTA